MLSRLGNAVRGLANWLGGWTRLALLVLVVAGIIGGLVWERSRHPLTPPGATEVATTLLPSLRQTAFRYAGSVDEVRAFYRDTLTARGWVYCGTQATDKCTNLIATNDGSSDQIDVYRRVGDNNFAGTTVEVWPQLGENGDTFVTVWETQAP